MWVMAVMLIAWLCSHRLIWVLMLTVSGSAQLTHSRNSLKQTIHITNKKKSFISLTMFVEFGAWWQDWWAKLESFLGWKLTRCWAVWVSGHCIADKPSSWIIHKTKCVDKYFIDEVGYWERGIVGNVCPSLKGPCNYIYFLVIILVIFSPKLEGKIGEEN